MSVTTNRAAIGDNRRKIFELENEVHRNRTDAYALAR